MDTACPFNLRPVLQIVILSSVITDNQHLNALSYYFRQLVMGEGFLVCTYRVDTREYLLDEKIVIYCLKAML